MVVSIDSDGKVALVGIKKVAYEKFLEGEKLKNTKVMKSSKKYEKQNFNLFTNPYLPYRVLGVEWR